jgi:hypothetical protein
MICVRCISIVNIYEVDQLIKTSMSTLVHMELFWNNFNQVRSIQNIWKQNNFKIFGNKKTKRIKQDRQNLLRSGRRSLVKYKDQVTHYYADTCII